MEEHEDGSRTVVSAKGGMLTSWNGGQVDKRLTHPAVVDRVLTIYLQNENITDKDVDKDLIRKALNEYRDSVTEREFVMMTMWILRSTSGSIFIDDSNQMYPGTIRGWLSNSGIYLTKYGVATFKKKTGNTLDDESKKLFADSILGKTEVVDYIYNMDIEEYFTKAITVEEYNNTPEGENVYAAVTSKIANLSDTAQLHVDNSSIIKMNDEQIHEIYTQLDDDEYIEMIAGFAKKWHNVLVKS